jgi:hypothetical protein
MSRRVLSLVCLLPGIALAQTHTGSITQIRMDTGANAALCVATGPELRGASWACLYPNRAHYREMQEILLRAFEKNAPCTFEWTQVDSMTNRARIEALTCFSQK